MQRHPSFDAVVLDLDGVVMQTGWEAALEGAGISRERWVRFWVETPWGRDFSIGACDPEAFATAATEDLGLADSPRRFLDFIANWLVGPFPGAVELLAELRAQITTGCLSNTNAPFVARYRGDVGLTDWFDHCFFSNEIGCMKPDPAVFRHVLSVLGIEPSRLLYLDDAERHVAAARTLGIVAERVQGIEAARQALVAHDFVLTVP